MVEMERTEWRDLRQENANKIEDPDIPDCDSIDVALRLRNMANEKRMATTEMRMVRWAVGVSMLEHRRNEEILEEAKVCNPSRWL